LNFSEFSKLEKSAAAGSDSVTEHHHLRRPGALCRQLVTRLNVAAE
jgi:hypothetical protein